MNESSILHKTTKARRFAPYLTVGEEGGTGMHARKPSILVVGTSSLQRRVRLALHEEGYDVLKASSYSRAVAMAHGYRPDLVLLDRDISGPGTMNGFDCCALIRQSLSMPIIVVSTIDDIQQKVQALDLGADDYLTEPWSIDELLARLRACLRRVRATPQSIPQLPPLDETILYSYDRTLRMDVARQEVSVDGESIYLTPKEFHLLYLLLRHAGKVLSYRYLLLHVWGEGYSEETSYVRVCICQLRKKLAHNFILTQSHVGYLFRDGPEGARQHLSGRKRITKHESDLRCLSTSLYREAI
jgi:two-component system KDP operon response regulator KdpE